jgi:DNA helicase-2/ATP-dependent DNA helicase PcrA
MISLTEFIGAVIGVALQGRQPNDRQRECIEHPLAPALVIVAGPGSGKTTVLVLRALRHVLVDGLSPDSILITTFTRKAAGEISSRVVGWGLRLIEHFRADAIQRGDHARAAWLDGLDLNGIHTGTVDTFYQQWLGETRQVGTPAPVMLEEFAANFVYRRRIFGPRYRTGGGQQHLDPYLAQYTPDQSPPRNQSQAADLSTEVNNRLIQDLVDVAAYSGSGVAQRIQAELLQAYRTHLQEQQLFNFSFCADRVLSALRAGTLYPELTPLRALLVDEYHDTNPIQEAIYFELVRQSGCSLTIVGDDDQSLYRFRGATVELFTNFQQRFAAQVAGNTSHLVYLVTNHRSTPEIVAFFNAFAGYDPGFRAARVAGKPDIAQFNPSRGVPILGMFRNDINDLAVDLTALLTTIFQGAGYQIPKTQVVLRRSEHGGAIGDAVFLASSVREYKQDNQGGLVERLPALLRRHLGSAGLGVFNPRGQDLRDLLNVQRLLGLVLMCLDPTDNIEVGKYLTRDTQRYIPIWRAAAQAFVASRPPPATATASLRTYVDGWRRRRASSGRWPDEIPLLDLLYRLIVWIPQFQHDPEHLVYLEAIMRCVVQGAHYSKYGFAIVNQPPHDAQSRNVVLTDLLAPVAEHAIEIDEDLLFAVPRNRLSIMTIHQSKGLEYPLVIVDVGSEFKINHSKQAFRRFPTAPSNTVRLESSLAPFTQIGPLRTARGDLDRTFDDLMRLYYVSFSRAQIALLLVGLTKNIEYSTPIKNIATFWSRQGAWSWRRDNPPLRRQTPTQPELLPLTLL